MRYLDAGTSASRMSRIGLGTWQFGSREWGYGDDYAGGEASRIVARAAEVGITLFDSAEAYGFGRSERILGAALAEHGLLESAYVATKIFPILPIAPVVKQRAIASRARLGIDRIDLYQVHQPNPVIKDGTTMAGMRELQDTGVVRDVGVSNYSLARWKEAEHQLGRPVISNQVEFSLAHIAPLDELVPYAAATNHVVIAWSPLGQGLLSAKYDATNRPSGGVRAMNPLFLPESLQSAQPLLETLREVAANHGATPAQVSLAWLIHHPGVVAIPGASSVEQVESNAAAADLSLGQDEVDALTSAARAFRPAGGFAAAKDMALARFRR